MELHSGGPLPHGQAPARSAELGQLRDFVNTKDIESSRDEMATPARLQAWLVTQKLIPAGTAVDAESHRRAMAVREGLRALGRANNDEPIDVDRVTALNDVAAALPVVVSADPGGWHLTPATTGVDGFLAGLMATLARSMADGSWSRVKACRRDSCQWLFFDQSRNRSGTWCSMAGCGSRMKARAYRARQRKAATV